MFKGSDDSVAWASPLPVQQSNLPHSSWAVLPDGTHAARLWKMPGEAFSLYSKIRVCSAPPWKSTPVTLSCITTGKEPNRTSHIVMISQCLWTLSPFTDWHLPSETCNFSGNSPSASCNALEVISLKRKQTEKEILQFSATPYTGHFFYSTATLLYKTVRTARSAHEFSVSTSRVLHCTKMVFLHIFI